MAWQEDAEGRAPAWRGVRIDEAAGLLDDAVYRRKAEPGALADVLGREERIEDFIDDVGRNAGAGVGHLDQHIVSRRHALVLHARGFGRIDIGGADIELAAVWHGIARVDREIDDDL